MDPKVVFDRPLESILNARLEELENDRGVTNSLIGVCFIVVGITGIWFHGLNVSRLMRLDSILPHGMVTLHFHLALANLGVVAMFPVGAITTFYNQWMLGSIGCQMYAFEGMACGMTSIALTCSLCIMHWLDVICQLRLRVWCYRSVAVLSWVSGLFWASLPLFGFGRYSLEPHKTTCSLDWGCKDHMITLTIFGFAIPVSLTVLVYCFVVRLYYNELANSAGAEVQPSTKKLQDFGNVVKLHGWILIHSILTWLGISVMACWSIAVGVANINPHLFYIPQLWAKLGCGATPVAYLILLRKSQRRRSTETHHETTKRD